MSYRSERFDPGELTGLEQAWKVVDLFDNNHVPVVNEVMSGARYRRQLHPDTVKAVGELDYLLQLTLEPEAHEDGARLQPKHFLDKAGVLLGAVKMPGETYLDHGGLNGWDITTTTKFPFGTGKTETEVLEVYPPWLKVRWEEAGRTCMFFCGIQPPRPKAMLEDSMFNWGERPMRDGQVVFAATPDNLETY